MYYGKLHTWIGRLVKGLAWTLLLGLCIPALGQVVGLHQDTLLRTLAALLAGGFLVQRPLASLALAHEMAELEKVTYEELEAKTLDNLRFFREEMARKKNPKEKDPRP